MQYRDTQANSLTAPVLSVVGGLSDLQLVPLDYPVTRGAQYVLNSNFPATLDEALSMATIHLPVVEEQLRQSQEVIDNLLTETRVLTNLINEGLNMHEDLDQLRADESEEELLEYSI